MMTIAEINGPASLEPIYFDMDDSGHWFLKQGDEWVVMDAGMLAKVCMALEKQLERM
jgi:hypothetical protein